MTTTKFGLFKFQSGYRKLYLNSPKGYSRKVINVQTAYQCQHGCVGSGGVGPRPCGAGQGRGPVSTRPAHATGPSGWPADLGSQLYHSNT